MYNSIAIDIAQRISNGEFPVGTKISGRTLLASLYNVSPETIRKAVSLLKDANVVSVSQGKEVVVQSLEQAYHFISHNNDMQSVYSLKQELELLLEQKSEIDKRFEYLLGEIINHSDRLKNLTPYNPVELKIPVHSVIAGKSIGECHLWENTGATVIAIRRGTEIIISPGLQAVLEPHDRVVLIGRDDVLKRVSAFIQPTNDKNA
jgi:K+/H+ antiporter YhaU regulatory subunit KhtT